MAELEVTLEPPVVIEATIQSTGPRGPKGEKGDPGEITVENPYDDTQIKQDITELQTGKADTSHSHAIADITGLQDALDGKQKELTAGSNITITEDGTISASGGYGSSEWVTLYEGYATAGDYFAVEAPNRVKAYRVFVNHISRSDGYYGCFIRRWMGDSSPAYFGLGTNTTNVPFIFTGEIFGNFLLENFITHNKRDGGVSTGDAKINSSCVTITDVQKNNRLFGFAMGNGKTVESTSWCKIEVKYA